METKSLYTILNVRPDATADQIETAYAELLHQLKDGTEDNPGGDDRIRLIAAKEAHSVLSNPITRQQYNQKLLAPRTLESVPGVIVIEPDNSGGWVKWLLFGIVAIVAYWVYNTNAVEMEKEKLRIEHEKALQESQLKLEEGRLREQKKQEAEVRAQQIRERMYRESRELDYRLEQESREQESRQQQALREQQYRQQQEATTRRQQQYEAERQLEREKQALQRLQNENRRQNNRYY